MVRDEKFGECASVGLGPISLNFHNVMPHDQSWPKIPINFAEFLRRVI
jgi:hypothetical protein